MRFANYLRLVLLVSVTIPFLVMTLLQYRSAQEAITREENVQFQLSEAAVRSLLSRLNTAEHLLLAAGEFVKSQGIQSKDSESIFLESIRKAFPDFLNIHIDDASGFSVAFSPRINAAGASNVGVNHQERYHWKMRAAAPGVRISDLVNAQGAANEPIINLSAPILSAQGEPEGYAVAALDLKALAAQVLAASADPRFAIAIADAKGKIIFASSEFSGFPRNLPPVHLVGPENKTWITLEAGSGTEETLQALLTRIPQTDWIAAVISPKKMHTAAIHEIVFYNGLIWLAIAFLTTLAAGFIAGPLVDAVTKLSAQVSAARTKPLREEIIRSPLELRALQHQYSLMASRLERANLELGDLNLKLKDEVRRQVKKAVENETAMTAVFRGLSEGLLLADARGVISYANASAQALLPEAYLPEGAGSLRRLLEDAFEGEAGGAARTGKLSVAGKILAYTSFELIDCGRLKRGVLLRDVTEEEKFNTLKDDLIGVVAHELKTPLSAIRLQAQQIKDCSQEARIQGKAEDLLNDADNMKALIESWLDVGRLESGSYKIQRELCQFKPVVRRAEKLNQKLGSFSLDLQIKEGAEILWADPQALMQILSNLISNSLRYAHRERPPAVKICAERQRNRFLMTFSDNGIGIEADKLSRIFEKFFQVEMGSKRKSGGTGLGLVIVRGLIGLHGGSVEVSSSPGSGTVFHISFPYPEA